MSAMAPVSTPDTRGDPVDPPDVVRAKVDVDRVLALLAEYRKELQAGIDEFKSATSMWGSGESKKVVSRLRPLQSAMERLARYASGLIENARIPEIDAIELQLQLAQMEGVLAVATETIR